MGLCSQLLSYYCNISSQTKFPFLKSLKRQKKNLNKEIQKILNALLITLRSISIQTVIVQFTETTYMNSSKSNLKQPGATHIHG